MTIAMDRPAYDRADFTEVTHTYAHYTVDVLVEEPGRDLPVFRPFTAGVGAAAIANQDIVDTVADFLAERDPNTWTDADGQPMPANAVAYRIIVVVSRTRRLDEEAAGAPQPAKFTAYRRVDLHHS